MQPLINLRQFVAVLILLIIPAALLTAYFRNFQPESDGQRSGAADGHHASAGQPAAGGGDGQAEMRDEEEQGSGEMDHSKMSGNAGGPAVQPALDAEQLEASRAQLEASRLQLEASRMALEAAKLRAPRSEKAAPADGAKRSRALESAGDGHSLQH